MLCNRCHEEIVDCGWDEDDWDGEEVDYRPVYGPRTEIQQLLYDGLKNAMKPMFRFKQFNDTKEIISKIGDSWIFDK